MCDVITERVYSYAGLSYQINRRRNRIASLSIIPSCVSLSLLAYISQSAGTLNQDLGFDSRLGHEVVPFSLHVRCIWRNVRNLTSILQESDMNGKCIHYTVPLKLLYAHNNLC